MRTMSDQAAKQAAQRALAPALEDLQVRWANATAKFRAGAALQAAGLREYGRAWQRVVRISRQGSRPAPGQPDTGGPLDPQNHRLNPRRLKAALGRSLAAAGINLHDSQIRRARR
jgi:hypothetical protein